MKSPKRLVFTTFGSLGDLHPYMAMAIEWQNRGHIAVIATSETYRTTVESEGIEFAPVRPDLPEAEIKAELMQRVMDMKNGPEYLIRRFIVPQVADSFADLLNACAGADGIVGHPLTFAVPIVAALKDVPWAYVALAPTTFLSAYDPPHLAPAPWTARLNRLGPTFYRLLFGLVKLRLRGWFDGVCELSRKAGTYPVMRDPLGADQFSKSLNLALFSPLFAAPQPDWPPHTVATGFPFYDCPTGSAGLPEDLFSFLEAGEPPIVFTLGSAAVMNPGKFYTESAAAARLLGRRAVLLVGRETGYSPQEPLPDTIHTAEYASFSILFPRCAAIVHQGGVGTTAQALRAGKPMLIMPYAFDQPDNGARAVRLGVARVIDRTRYSADTASSELRELLENDAYVRRAEMIGRLIRMENGTAAACDYIESRLFGCSV